MADNGSLERIKTATSSTHSYKSRPTGLKWRSSTSFVIATVAIGMFTDLFLYSLVVPVFPFLLEDRIGIPRNRIQSNVSMLLAIYAGASVLFSPIAGILADKVSTRQIPFLLGLLALLSATTLLAVGQSIAVLALARILQGISGAVVWTLGLAICLETVGPSRLGTTIGSIFSLISVGTLAAPVLGGLLYRKTGLTGVFGLSAGLLGVDCIMRLLVIERKVAARYGDYDDSANSSPASSSSSTFDASPNQSRTEGPSPHDHDEESPLLNKTQENGEDNYRLPDQPRWVANVPILACFRDSSLITAALIAFVQAALLAAFDSTIPTVAEDYYNFDSLRAGLLFLPLGICDLVIGPVAGWVTDRYGTKTTSTLGYVFLTPTLVLLRLPQSGSRSQIILYCYILALNGVGLAIIGAPSIVEAGAVVERYYKANPEFFGSNGPYAQLYGINSMVFSSGLTLGPLIAGGLKDSIGYGNMNAVLAALCFFTAVLSYMYIGGRPGTWPFKRAANLQVE